MNIRKIGKCWICVALLITAPGLTVGCFGSAESAQMLFERVPRSDEVAYQSIQDGDFSSRSAKVRKYSFSLDSTDHAKVEATIMADSARFEMELLEGALWKNVVGRCEPLPVSHHCQILSPRLTSGHYEVRVHSTANQVTGPVRYRLFVTVRGPLYTLSMQGVNE